MQSLAKRAGTP